MAGTTPQPVSTRLFAAALPEFFIVAGGFEAGGIFGVPDQRRCIPIRVTVLSVWLVGHTWGLRLTHDLHSISFLGTGDQGCFEWKEQDTLEGGSADQMKTTVLMPEGFETYLRIQNASERFEEARNISRTLLDGGIALKANADHYAIFSDPPRLLAGPLKQVGYVVGADNRCYPSPVDGCDYINVAASLPPSSPAREKGWPDHVAIVHPVDESAYSRMMEQGYGNPFIHHITWGIVPPGSPLSEDPASLISRMVQVRETISRLLNETPGTLIIALPREVVQAEGFQEQFYRSIGSTPKEQYQLEVMEGGGYLLQFFVLKGGRIEVAMRSQTNQTFNPKSVHKISKDELSVDQGQSASAIKT